MPNKTFIVAEAGVNANADLEKAIMMINVAFQLGIDAIKFQLWEKGRFTDLEQYRFEFSQMVHIKQYAEAVGLKWFCTPFDFESIDFLNELGMDIWKVPSGMVTNYGYLQKMAEQEGRFILSTGMSDWKEIDKALEILEPETDKNITFMQCTSVYPAPYSEVNLRILCGMENCGYEPYGLSDHTLGIEIPIAAVALGASVIEKHFTLDRNMPGPDQKMSLEPDELKAMVKAIRNVELALSGDGIKRPTPSEMKHRDEIRERMKL